MPPLRPLVLDALAVTAVAAALAVTVAGYVRNFPDAPTGYAAQADDWTDPVTTGSIEPKAGGGADEAANERPEARPSRPAANSVYRVWTDPSRRSASDGVTSGVRDETARQR